jgi:hypothetical protein
LSEQPRAVKRVAALPIFELPHFALRYSINAGRCQAVMLHVHMHPLLQRAKGALAAVYGINRGRRDGEGILAAATTIAAIRHTVRRNLSTGINGPMNGDRISADLDNSTWSGNR